MLQSECDKLKKSLDTLTRQINATSNLTLSGNETYSYAMALRIIAETHTILANMKSNGQIVSDDVPVT